MSSVQAIVKQGYASMHYIDCYTNQLNLVMQQDTGHILEVWLLKIVFWKYNCVSYYFFWSSELLAVLDAAVSRRLPRLSYMRLNFTRRLVYTVYLQEQRRVSWACGRNINVWKIWQHYFELSFSVTKPFRIWWIHALVVIFKGKCHMLTLHIIKCRNIA